MNRSKRCVSSLEQVHLVESSVLPFLITNVLANRRLISPQRRNEVPPRPKVMARKILSSSYVGPRNVDRTLPLDKPNHLGYRIRGRNGDQHVHVVTDQIPLLDLRFSLLGQVVKHLAQVLAKFPVQGLSAVFRNKYHVVLAFPLCMLQALI